MTHPQAFTRWLGTNALNKYTKRFAQPILARPFAKKGARRLLIYFNPLEISWVQIYPYLFYANQIKDTYDVEIRCLPIDDFLTRQPPKCGPADLVLIQPWFTVDHDVLRNALDHLLTQNPEAQVSFIDSYAHSDLRLGHVVDPYIRFYLKKSFFKDRSLYLRAYRGDTNLTEYFGDLYGIDQPLVDWATPESLLPKLRLSPNFHMAPRFLNMLAKGHQLPEGERALDIQTRLGKKGSPWYSAMREHAMKAAFDLPGLKLSPPGKLSYPRYMAEMEDAKICFSPFGYGELCWRDIEAIVTGAILLKPDMDHLETLPDLYEKGVTYHAVDWDLSDLPSAVEYILSHPDMRSDMARTAHQRLLNYVDTAQFVEDINFLFDDAQHA